MDDLIKQFIAKGLSEEQAVLTLQAIHEWVQEHYPVAGVLLGSWINKDRADRS